MNLLATRRSKVVLIAGLWGGAVVLNIMLMPRRYAPHVDVELTQLMPMPLLVRASGNLEAKDSNTVKAQFDGPVNSKNFREGQSVKKGQVLAIIGRERIKVDYQAKHDALINADADLKRARRDLRLQKELFKKEAVAYSTVEDAQRTLVKSEQGLRSAQESMKVAQDQWNSSTVVAPISGTVVKDWIGEDKFMANGKEIVTVADISEYTVHAKVDELDIHQVREGQLADVTVQIFPKDPLKAVVTQVGSQTDGTGLPEIPVVMRLLATGGLDLRPKLTAESRISIGKTEPVISVPLTALVNNDGDPHVWVLSSINRLKKRRVETGRTNPDRIEIVSGLSPKEWVCVTAEPDFSEGMMALVAPPGSTSGRGSRTAKFLPDPKKDSATAKKAPKKSGVRSLL